MHMRTVYTGTLDGVLVERQWQRPDGTWVTFKQALAEGSYDAITVGAMLKKADA